MKQGALKPEKYIPRLIDRVLSERLDLFGAVEVAGPMWCGKTWTSMSFGESIARIGLQAARIAAEADAETALIGAKPHVIDEWQDVPAIWDEVRARVDDSGGEPGQFILTGSSQPQKEKAHHSGAGRISKIQMRTMSLAETGLSTGAISLSGLFRGEFEARQVQQRLQPLAEAVCRGGWPQLISHPAQPASPFLKSYLDALFEVSAPRRGLAPAEARIVAQSLARNLGSAAKLATVAEDAGFSNYDAKSSANKVSAIIRAFEDLYVIEGIRGWDAPIRSKSRLRTKPKYVFSDVSLAASLLNLSPERLMNDGQVFGILFESLCLHDLAVYASLLPESGPEPLRYYRDSDGLEVDAILELQDGRWAGIEIKLGESKAPEGIANLLRLKQKIAANPAARNPEPAFLAVVVGAGEYARYDRENGVYIVPITALGA